MEYRPFSDKINSPEELRLKKVLDSAYPFYKSLLKLSSDFRQEWIHSKLSGWMLKVNDSKKALYYIIPFEKMFRVSLTIREKEKEILLNDKELKELKNLIQEAQKFSEGYALKTEVTSAENSKVVAQLISKIIALRK